jgi:hypothetical protein
MPHKPIPRTPPGGDPAEELLAILAGGPATSTVDRSGPATHRTDDSIGSHGTIVPAAAERT